MDLYATHLPLLIKSIIRTSGPVLELGVGYYSTPILHELCYNRQLVTLEVETEREWMAKFTYLGCERHVIQPVASWDQCPYLHQHWAVAFVDHRPGEDRKRTIDILEQRTEIIVVHDTEEPSYGYETVFKKFKYRFDYQIIRPWTTQLSNWISLPLD